MENTKYYLFAYWHDSKWKGFVGASVKIQDLAHNLAKMGNDVVLFIPKNNFKKEDFVHKIIEIPFINYPFLRLFSFNLFLLIFLTIQLFKKTPSVVYVRRMNSLIPALYAKICRAIFFYEINDDPYSQHYKKKSNIVSFLRAKISIKQDEINLKLCDSAFVITKEIIEKIHSKNPNLKKNKLDVMPSGANIDLLKPLDKIRCREILKLKKDKKIVCFAGTLLEHQGLEILIESAPQILKNIPDTIFLIIGEGPQKQNWIDLVKKQNLDQNFFFSGQILYKDIPGWINAADLCIAPFMNYAGLRSPVKIFDYLACGKAVVASKIKGTTDLFEKSGAVLLVEAENPKILAKKIIELLNDEKKAKQMGADGRRFVLMNFDRMKIAKKISERAKKYLKNKNQL